MSVHQLIRTVALVVIYLVVYCHGQKTIPVAVGREGDELKLRFSPEEVFAEVGDMIQFQFYPVNHSAVQADFGAPCVPMANNRGLGFFSGFRPLPLNTETIITFTINVTRPDPIFFYCSQGRHCQQGFVGVINPTVEQSLVAFKQAASAAPETLSPGESSTTPSIEPAPQTEAGLDKPSAPPDSANADNDRTTTNVGAIVGGVVGGVAVLVVLVVFLVLRIMWRRRRAVTDDDAKTQLKYTIGKPELQQNSAYGSYL